MNRNLGFLISSCLLSTALISRIPAALGATVNTDARIPNVVLPLQALGATLDLLAFSQEFKFDEAGRIIETKTNETTFNSVTGMSAVTVPGGGITVVVKNDKRTYDPIVGFRNLAPKPKQIAGVTSRTGNAGATAALIFAASQTGRALFVSASVPILNPQSGRAAAEATDPSTLAPGSYSYSYTINALELGINAQNEFAGVNYFATDSRFSDPLWILSIVAKEALVTSDDLIINFVSNPILAQNDSMIESKVRNAFNVSPGLATLSSFEVFSTTYSVNQTIRFSEGLKGGAETTLTVPEPTSTLSLLALGTLGAASTLKRKLKPSKSSEKQTEKVT